MAYDREAWLQRFKAQCKAERATAAARGDLTQRRVMEALGEVSPRAVTPSAPPLPAIHRTRPAPSPLAPTAADLEFQQVRAATLARHAAAAAALRARADAADRALGAPYRKVLSEYESAAAALAEKAAALEVFDHEADAVNYALRQARKEDLNGNHPPFVKTSTERYRTEPDVVEPERHVVDHEMFVDGRPAGVMVSTVWQGTEYPQTAGAEKRKVTRTIPGNTRPGRSMSSPTLYLVIPSARLGAEAFWPRRPKD